MPQSLPPPHHFASETHPSYLRQNFDGPPTAFIQVASTLPCQNQTRISDARTPSQLRHRDLRPSGSLAGRGLIISHEWKEDSPLSPSPRIRRAILRQFADPCSCWHVAARGWIDRDRTTSRTDSHTQRKSQNVPRTFQPRSWLRRTNSMRDSQCRDGKGVTQTRHIDRRPR